LSKYFASFSSTPSFANTGIAICNASIHHHAASSSSAITRSMDALMSRSRSGFGSIS
jgi:hypothetical protein